MRSFIAIPILALLVLASCQVPTNQTASAVGSARGLNVNSFVPPDSDYKKVVFSDLSQGYSVGFFGTSSILPDASSSPKNVILKSSDNATTILGFQLVVKNVVRVYFEFSGVTEQSYDKFRFKVNGIEKLGPLSGALSGKYWVYLDPSMNVNSGNTQITWEYNKDGTDSPATDYVKITNIHLDDVRPLTQYNGTASGHNTYFLRADYDPYWLPSVWPWMNYDTLLGYIPNTQNTTTDRYPIVQWKHTSLYEFYYNTTFDPAPLSGYTKDYDLGGYAFKTDGASFNDPVRIPVYCYWSAPGGNHCYSTSNTLMNTTWGSTYFTSMDPVPYFYVYAP